MSLWIPFTLLAALMQAIRNALQKTLSTQTSVLGATLARFLFASPLALLYLLGLYQWQPYDWPEISAATVAYVLGAAVMQILATALMVKLFTWKNYAIGVGLAKSEAVLAALLGVLCWQLEMSMTGWCGVALGGVAVFLLAGASKTKALSWPVLGLGLGSGLAFALAGLWVRDAALSTGLVFLPAAAWVLLAVILTQSLLLGAWVLLKEPATLVTLWRYRRLTFLSSLTSALGSLGWFTAMSLHSVAYVKTLGQVEVLFSLLISTLVLKERLKAGDLAGLVMVVAAAVLVMWA
ncbi:EamA family transporter [Rheinheimera sp.]|uniref:EamA family transporter n=1 Tax=Rheinheimera sp. TaxID=1869214 RepID=UPI00307F9044